MFQNFSGRLAEVERQTAHGCSNLDKLWAKIRRCKHFVPGMTASQAKDQVTQLLHTERQKNLASWRARLRHDSKEVFRWVQKKHVCPTVNIYDDETDASATASDHVQGALEVIHGLWDRVWE